MDKSGYHKRVLHNQTAQQSVPHDHRDNAPDAGDCPEGVRTSQAVFYALAFFWLDGCAKSTQVSTGQTANRWAAG